MYERVNVLVFLINELANSYFPYPVCDFVTVREFRAMSFLGFGLKNFARGGGCFFVVWEKRCIFASYEDCF